MDNDNDTMTCTRKEFMKQVLPKMREAHGAGLVKGFLFGVALSALVYWLS